jgi:hypothetical protein
LFGSAAGVRSRAFTLGESVSLASFLAVFVPVSLSPSLRKAR